MPNGVQIILKAMELINDPSWPPEEKYITISREDFLKKGCPSCGFKIGHKFNFRPEGYTWGCNNPNCKKYCFILSDKLSAIPDNLVNILPELIPHPRRIRIRSHKKKITEDGVKLFGIYRPSPGDIDYGRGNCSCFACVDSLENQFNLKTRTTIVLYVRLKEECEEIMRMFGYGAYISEEEGQSDLFKLSIGACHKHFDNLVCLLKLLRKDSWITPEKIKKARNYTG